MISHAVRGVSGCIGGSNLLRRGSERIPRGLAVWVLETDDSISAEEFERWWRMH